MSALAQIDNARQLTLQMVEADTQRYLDTFPAERPELSRLLNQLADKDEGLFTRKNMRGHLTASALVLNVAQTHVFFIHHKASDFWMQPGGHYENEPSLWDNAQREVAEETGLTAITLHPWHNTHDHPFDLHTHAIAARPEKNEGDHFHHDFLYLAQSTMESATLQAEEITGGRWIALHELHTLKGLRLRDRFLPKLKAINLL